MGCRGVTLNFHEVCHWLSSSLRRAGAEEEGKGPPLRRLRQSVDWPSQVAAHWIHEVRRMPSLALSHLVIYIYIIYIYYIYILYIYISFQVHPESTWYCTVEEHMGHTADATPQTFLSNPSDSLRLIKSGSGSFKIYIGSSPVHVCRETFSEQWAWAVRITYGQLCKHQHQLAWGWSSARSEWTVPMVALVAPIACANASCVPS